MMANGVTADGTATAGQRLPMATRTTASIVSIKDMAAVDISGATGECTMECFEKTVVMAEGRSPGRMVLCTKENFDRANVKDKDRTSLVMEDGTKAVGKMVDTTAMVFASGRTDGVTRENGSTAWLTGKALKPLRMGLFGMTVNGLKTNLSHRKNCKSKSFITFNALL